MEAGASIGWLAPPTWLSLVILAVTFIIIYTYWVYDNRRKFNLPGPTPLPVLGNTLEVISKGLIGFDAAMVQKYGKLVAINGSGRIGDILVADLDILKEIMVRRASSFTDRNEDPAPMFEPFNQSLTFSKGEHWKQMRSTITPAFSSGKLKQMEALILACADRLVQNLKKKAQGDEDIDIKRMFDPYTMDVIASTSFGLQLDAQGNPNHPFIKNAKELMEPSLHSPVILILREDISIFDP
ncbi:cytochrome P450 3A8 [Lingula anatina]|uniref:Cytochrome P450 3A8 n=1 Tax=Lingula anatina TaxID=7574 RepID=A0A1S3JWY6_LINAN|nr:cytochrome P450 3A8 [Lingula anatina]|eukprot:XP_013414549.1 cytochrome P450 3A8 [Lingula anatina]